MSLSVSHQINPYIRVAMHSRLGDGLKIAQRAIFDYELIYIEQGKLAFSYAGREYIVGEGEFLFIHPAVSHSFDCRFGELYQPHIQFDAIYTPKSRSIPISYKDIDKFTPDELALVQEDVIGGGASSPIISFADKERALELFYEVIRIYGEGDILLCKARLCELIYLILRDNFEACLVAEIEQDYTVAEHIKAYIDAEQGFSMSLDDFEKHFSYSKFHLEKLFREKYGESLISYRNRKKMNLAGKLLEKMSVSEVAEMLSFSSIYVFSRAFKNFYGISPSKYAEGFAAKGNK